MEYSGQEGLFRQAGTAGRCGSFGSKQYFQGGITVFCVNFSFKLTDIFRWVSLKDNSLLKELLKIKGRLFMLVNLNDVLKPAIENHYGVGLFNVCSLKLVEQ